jgi:hypothetical protein
MRISAKPNAPISAGMSEMPPARLLLPKVKRLNVRLPVIMTPKTPSQKNSKAPKESATSPRLGVKRARHTMPKSEPTTDPVVAIPIARPACPFCARAKPSRHAAALAAVPGMLSRIAVRLPP